MDDKLQRILDEDTRMFNPTAGMTYKEVEEYELIEACDYYDVVETEDGLDAISYTSDPADIVEDEEEECIRLFGINFNVRSN